ncbi:MAG: SH3 domain-containing protein [Candidatus Thiodiazotropha lotti]|nr:SH3 domain-containing protein [Candidatus Thiodiazotropha lotti]
MNSRNLHGGAFELGMSSLNDGDFAEAFCLWRPLAMQGHVEAAYHLGWLYANGNGLRVDIDKAVYWWKRSAAQGHNEAMFALALAYTNGEGIKKNHQEAFKWYRTAAERGHGDAREIIKSKLLKPEKVLINQLKTVLQSDWLSERRVVKADVVNLRAGPGTEYPVIKRGEAGSRLFIIDRKGKWLLAVDPDDLSQAWIADWLTILSE